MTARRHHYVPQCYLKGFCRHRDKPKLFVVDAKRLSTFATHPANVAAERDFHAVEIDGLSPDALENQFAQFESDLSHSLERIISARSIADEADRATTIAYAERQFYARDEEFRYFSPHRSNIMRGAEVINDQLLRERQTEDARSRKG
jgi:Protein of unknown function (DUF4238)